MPEITRRNFVKLIGLSSLGGIFIGNMPLLSCFAEDDLGIASLEGDDVDPTTNVIDLVARTKSSLYLTYVAGSSGLPVNGQIRITYSGINSTGIWMFQTANPTYANYVTASTSGTGNVSVDANQIGVHFNIDVKVLDSPLQEGESITVVIGDTSEGGLGWSSPENAGHAVMPFFPCYYLFLYPNAFRVRVAADGTNFEDIPSGQLPINVVPRSAKQILIAPFTSAVAGVPMRVTLLLHDEYGNCDYQFEGNVDLSCTDLTAIMPATVVLTAADQGRITLNDIILNTPGTHRIEAAVPGTQIVGRSSAIICTGHEVDYKYLWGDLHVHTVASDGHETQEKMFEFARRNSGLDFQGTSEHSWKTEHASVIDVETTQQVEMAYEPGVFTTIKGFEWINVTSPKIGHHNVYYKSTEPPVLAHCNGIYRDYDVFFAEVAKYDAIIIPHHTAKAIFEGFYKKWEYHPVKQERLVEIYSTHGLSEYQGNPRAVNIQKEGHNVQDALAMGYKLGFVGSSDSHTSRPGLRHYRDMNYRDGIACVLARENTREEVWQAMWDRRCYATTGFRIILEFTVNGEMMGREIPLGDSDPVELKVRAIGFTGLESVEVIKGSIGASQPLPVVHTVYPGDETCEFTWIDPAPLSDCFYYIRVIQTDGEMAWSSPIWVSPSMRIQGMVQDAVSGDVIIHWGCLPYRLYSVYYKNNIDADWQLAQTDIPSDESGTIEWTDDGSLTGNHPSTIQTRLYSVQADG